MLKKFKSVYNQFFNNQNYQRQEQLSIKNHIVDIKGTKYFLAKAMMTDVPEITRLEKSVSNLIPWKKRAFKKDIKQKQSRLYLVLRHQDKMVAFIGCHFEYAEHDCHISNIAVMPDYQNHGLGYYLLTEIVKKARRLDLNTVTLEVRKSNKNAINLYHDLGFIENGILPKYYYDNQEDALKMTLNIVDIDKHPNNFGL